MHSLTNTYFGYELNLAPPQKKKKLGERLSQTTFMSGITFNLKEYILVNMAKFLQSHSQKHKTVFLWKYFATSHGTGVDDGIGGKAKALV